MKGSETWGALSGASEICSMQKKKRPQGEEEFSMLRESEEGRSRL